MHPRVLALPVVLLSLSACSSAPPGDDIGRTTEAFNYCLPSTSGSGSLGTEIHLVTCRPQTALTATFYDDSPLPGSEIEISLGGSVPSYAGVSVDYTVVGSVFHRVGAAGYWTDETIESGTVTLGSDGGAHLGSLFTRGAGKYTVVFTPAVAGYYGAIASVWN